MGPKVFLELKFFSIYSQI